MSDSRDVTSWETDLIRAGWREVRLNVWRRPDGALFRGPYGAWCALNSIDLLDGQTPITQLSEVRAARAGDPARPLTMTKHDDDEEKGDQARGDTTDG